MIGQWWDGKSCGVTPTDVWNNGAAKCSLTRVRDITEDRQAALRRAREQFRTLGINDPIEGFELVVGCITNDAGMCGGNKSGWKATFDWMLKKSNLTRLVEQAMEQRR